MARFVMELPDELMKDFKRLHDNAEKIFGEMTRAGAKVVENNIRANAPKAVKSSAMMNNLGITKTYKTPSDGGINTKVIFAGYFTAKDGRTVPAPLVANLFEYGRSDSPFPKHPFIRKSFKAAEIEKAMLEAQKKASGGLLDE